MSGLQTVGHALQAGVAVGPETSTLVAPTDPVASWFLLAAVLGLLLATLDLVLAGDRPDPDLRLAITLVLLPLVLTFAAIVLFESLSVVDAL